MCVEGQQAILEAQWRVGSKVPINVYEGGNDLRSGAQV